MTKQFKVGDRVVFTKGCPRSWWFGPHTEYKEGTVSHVNGEGTLPIWVSVDGKIAYVAPWHIELKDANSPTAPVMFKIGDRVEIDPDATINNEGPGNILVAKKLKGNVHTVREVTLVNYGLQQMVFLEGWEDSFYSGRFKLAPAEDKGTFILILERDGKLLPATEPRIYNSEQQATAVAKKMAVKNPGCDFKVFRAVFHARFDGDIVKAI